MKFSLALLFAPLLLAARQPQDDNRGPTAYPDPHSKENRQRMKAYPLIAEEGGKRAEKIEHIKGDLHYLASDPYSDDPIEYSGSFVLQRSKDSAEAYLELGLPGAGGKIKPMVRIYETSTTLTVVNEEDLTLSESAVDPASPKAWRPWSLLLHPANKDVADAFDVQVLHDGEPHKVLIQRTEEELKKWYGDGITAEELKRLQDQNDKLTKDMTQKPAIITEWKAKDTTCFMRDVQLTLDHDLYFPTHIIAHNKNATTVSLSISNLKTTDAVDKELFKAVPKLRDEKGANGAAKYRKVN